MAQNVDPILEIGRIVTRLTGVQLGEKNRAMIMSRLTKRISELSLRDFDAYFAYVQQNEAKEIPYLVSSLTTHHTYFFREIAHFEFLTETALPALIESTRKRPDKKVRVLSAACSRGQEVYSLGMWLDEYLSAKAPDLSFQIMGCDVDPESISIAKNGVYFWRDVKEIPMHFLQRYWDRGKGDISEYARVKNTVRSRCEFRVENLLNPKLEVEPFDLIFCRNVFIYFSPEEVKRASLKLISHLRDGYFFTGVSESLNVNDMDLERAGPSIYRKKSAARQDAVAPQPPKAAPALAVAPPAKLRVICVDDSPIILTLLSKILTPQHGFEIVGTAKNGAEAETVAKHKIFDVMTLDVHMPVKTGIDYLKGIDRASHPPVMMLTSVSREDKELAAAALSYGAGDFVEKPSLSNLEQRAEEIRSKLRTMVRAKAREGASTVEKTFQVSMDSLNPQAWRGFLVGSGQLFMLGELLRESRFPMAKTYVNFTDQPNASALDMMKQKYNVNVVTNEEMASHVKMAGSHPFCVMALGDPAQFVLPADDVGRQAWLIVEEAYKDMRVPTVPMEAVPYSSFAYVADLILCKRAA